MSIKADSLALDKRFFLHTGKINCVAINKDGNGSQYFLDQHGVTYFRADLDRWEGQGTLKIYCPSFLIAFEQGDDYRMLNKLMVEIKPMLDRDIPFHDAIFSFQDDWLGLWFIQRIENWIARCIQSPSELLTKVKDATKISYDRSMILQEMFLKRCLEKINPLDQLALAIGHLKSVYIAMAPHYGVEAHMDDAFINCPWHLPDVLHNRLQNLCRELPAVTGVDYKRYLMGMHYDMGCRLSADMYRFNPILSSLIAPYVCENNEIKRYASWQEFRSKVVCKLPSETVEIFSDFAREMKISFNASVFAGYRMLAKDVRKRGWKFLYAAQDALNNYRRLKELHLNSFAYYCQNFEMMRDIIGKRNHNHWHRLLKLQAVVEYYNSFIGCYKFIPWRIDDSNFNGQYLPYNVMAQAKKVLYKQLLNGNSDVWQPKGYWFRDVLGSIITDNPTLYAKWFIPILEDDYIDRGIIKAADQICYENLKLLN